MGMCIKRVCIFPSHVHTYKSSLEMLLLLLYFSFLGSKVISFLKTLI